MNILKQSKLVFKEDSKFKVFLLSLLITGLSYGLYKGMLDNYLAEVVGMGLISAWACMISHNLLLFTMFCFYYRSGKWNPMNA